MRMPEDAYVQMTLADGKTYFGTFKREVYDSLLRGLKGVVWFNHHSNGTITFKVVFIRHIVTLELTAQSVVETAAYG